MKEKQEEILYEKEFLALNKEKINYAICGGIAVILYGYPRFTGDLDLVVDLDKKNLEKLFDLLVKLKYKLKIPIKKEDFIDKNKLKELDIRKHMKVVSFYNVDDPMRIIDVCVNLPNIQNLLKNKIYKRVKNDLKIPAISKKDLIKMKEVVARPLDINDVENLKKIK